MARDKACLQARNLKLINFYLKLRNELTDLGKRRFSYQHCIEETAKEFDLTPSTVEKITFKNSIEKILAQAKLDEAEEKEKVSK